MPERPSQSLDELRLARLILTRGQRVSVTVRGSVPWLWAGVAVVVLLAAQALPEGIARDSVRSFAGACLLGMVLWSPYQWRRLWWVLPIAAVAGALLLSGYRTGRLSGWSVVVLIGVMGTALASVVRQLAQPGVRAEERQLPDKR